MKKIFYVVLLITAAAVGCKKSKNTQCWRISKIYKPTLQNVYSDTICGKSKAELSIESNKYVGTDTVYFFIGI